MWVYDTQQSKNRNEVHNCARKFVFVRYSLFILPLWDKVSERIATSFRRKLDYIVPDL